MKKMKPIQKIAHAMLSKKEWHQKENALIQLMYFNSMGTYPLAQ